MHRLSLPLLILLPILAACAATGGKSAYQQEMEALEARCTERQGILVPTGAQTGQPATEYACRITGASRIAKD